MLLKVQSTPFDPYLVSRVCSEKVHLLELPVGDIIGRLREVERLASVRKGWQADIQYGDMYMMRKVLVLSVEELGQLEKDINYFVNKSHGFWRVFELAVSRHRHRSEEIEQQG